jgi:hypothetical protein
MRKHSRSSEILWNLLLGLISTALLGSIWAGFFAGGCGSCAGATGGTGTLGRAGAAYYALLLGAALMMGRSRLVWVGLLLAGSMHASLLALLFTRGELCLPCVVTGAAAIGAATIACILEPFNLARVSVLLPGVALATPFAVFSLGLFTRQEAAGMRALPTVTPERRPGTVTMTVYERADCVYCQRLEEEVLPALVREFGQALEVERRSADEIPGLPTPTIVLSGPGGRRAYPGLPGGDTLRQAVLETLGGPHDGQAMLPTSR